MIKVSKLELQTLMNSDEFSRVLDNDPVLNELEAELEHANDELLQFVQLTGNCIYIDGVRLRPLTPALWTMLYLMKCNFMTGVHEVGHDDIDLMLYALSHNILTAGGDFADIRKKAAEFGKRHIRDYDETGTDLAEVILNAFYPLTLLKAQGASGSKFEKYDCDWLVTLAAIAAKYSGRTIEYCMKEMPLALCWSLYVQHRREVTGEAYSRRTSVEIGKAQFERTFELGKIFYCEKNNLKMDDVVWL